MLLSVSERNDGYPPCIQEMASCPFHMLIIMHAQREIYILFSVFHLSNGNSPTKTFFKFYIHETRHVSAGPP